MTRPLDEFVSRWNAASPPVPFVEVINTNVDLDNMPDRWGSALQETTTAADVTLGSNPWVEETGHIAVVLVARAGQGQTLLDDAVTWLRSTFHGWRTPDAMLHFRGVVGPAENDPAAEGEWWRLGFAVPYVWQSRRVEPVP